MPGKRLYTEKEFSSVLKRAAELQRIEGIEDAPGLSLAELEQIAEDAGISPNFVKRAAFELEQGPPEKGDGLLGGPTQLDLELIVDGEMTGPKWDQALASIKHMIGADGKEILEGPTREWIHRDQMGGRVRVSMSPAGRQTRIHLSYGMTEWLWLHFIMVCVGIAPVAVQYALLNLGALIETGIGLLILMAFYMIGWISFRVFTRRQDRKLRKLLARLDDIVAQPEATATQQTVPITQPETGRIDAPWLSDEAPSDIVSPMRRPHREGT